MGDFYQNGVITTLHDFRKRSLEDLGNSLVTFSRGRPLGLILPSLFSELKGQALKRIIDELCQVPYLDEIIKGTFRSIKATYFRMALDMVAQYHADAVINGLDVDHHREEAVVDLFSQNIYRAGEEFLANPMQTPFVPSWKRVVSAVPGFLEAFFDAVEEDNRAR